MLLNARMFVLAFFPDIFVIENYVIEKISKRVVSNRVEYRFVALSRVYPKLQIKIIPRFVSMLAPFPLYRISPFSVIKNWNYCFEVLIRSPLATVSEIRPFKHDKL